ncbi:TlpA family protein disulfide reductase [Candidatus Viridilinea mediisalina]|uniref:Thioredoxin domain-containing protein n=1 Tax=Candidatus Viridilinea mediisalina TaxID=2024553 RepID=A0A2A6RLP4_9CHLR|nr:TlpA disulfide reductase family protein [Candidatus Viridilinea mediisalina]PDW03831.1 hypothetical protein CJ255_06670 [Candidatus Viridilinea mediisalina]
MLLRWCTILLILMLLTACGRQTTTPIPPELELEAGLIAPASQLLDTQRGAVTIGAVAPDFRFHFSDGTTRQLSDLRGQPVIINFWATWCLPCIEELPAFEEVYQEAEGAFAILAINRNELPAAIARFAPSVAVSFPLIADPTGTIGDRYTVTSLPTTYFIDSDGNIHARHVGVLTAQQLREQLREL